MVLTSNHQMQPTTNTPPPDMTPHTPDTPYTPYTHAVPTTRVHPLSLVDSRLSTRIINMSSSIDGIRTDKELSQVEK